MKRGEGLAFCIVLAALSQGFAQVWPTLDKDSQSIYDSIFAPRVMAVPPGDAPCGPSVTDDGRLLSIGSRWFGERKMLMTLESADLGLNWTLRPWRESTDVVLCRCPWADYSINVCGPGEEKDVGRCWIRRPGPDGRVAREFVRILGVTTYGKLRPLMQRKRWIFAFYRKFDNRIGYYPCLVYSDDDGRTWSPRIEITNTLSAAEITAPDKSHRWETGCHEPDLIELKDGSLLMVARAATDHHGFYRSRDGGLTWSGPVELPAFWSSNTQPLFLRLGDGRILFFWNNTQILPRFDASECPELSDSELCGRWEAVFTNRDALHVAISEDEGETWIGFRELALNEIRNREDYRESGNEFWQMKGGSGIDKSVHQAQALELPGGKVAVTYGQSVASRRLVIFDVKWLYEKSREENLKMGTANLSNHLYLRSLLGGYRGWSGHCAMNRIPGAAMVREPDTDRKTRRECLQVCRIRDERLVDDHQGVVWNFPAARKGKVEFECRIDGAGVRVSLCDHWINPCDWAVADRAAFSVPLNASGLGGAGKWSVIAFSWDLDAATVTVSCDGHEKRLPLKTAGFSPFGVSYLHLQTLAQEHDPKGAYFRWFRMRGE